MASEIIFGGGDNYFQLSFKMDNLYEIVPFKGKKVTGTQEEGTYPLKYSKGNILTTVKNEQKTSFTYVLTNHRTLNRVTETEDKLTCAY